MKMNTIFVKFCFNILFIIYAISAKQYEGTIGQYPIYLNLIAPANDGTIQGSYFYQNVGQNIRLSGEKKGLSLTFSEYNAEKVTGQFICAIKDEAITGKWISGNGKKKLIVTLKECDSIRMADAQQEALLNVYDLEAISPENESDEESKDCYHTDLFYYFKNKYIRSLNIGTSYTCGPYPSGTNILKTYSTETRTDILFWQEIDSIKLPTLISLFKKELQKQLTECRNQYPDSEWIHVFDGWVTPPNISESEIKTNPQKALDKIFTVYNVVDMLKEFNIEPNGHLKLSCCGYFGIPHVRAAMDFCGVIEKSINDLSYFLKPNSILNKIKG
jgi:hypothetical protein